MDPTKQPGPERIKEIFEQAIDLDSVEARLAYAKGACGADAALLARVQTLLRAHEQSGEFMGEHSVFRAALQSSGADGNVKPGAMIGRYKLLQEIGEGGCGMVYMAEQEEPVRRRVALKVIKSGMDTKEVIARFEAERQALAMMDHPNIAKVLDAGATEQGRPFFAMELVKGIPITRYCDDNNLSTAERLKLFTQVCHAVQHAHQKGIIHRDLKPSNILVTLHDGVPVPKVIDFGIAKATQGRLTDHTLFTAFAQFIGTPAYMSPEQAEMSGLDIDTRSDIYSLGVLLYELLTGRTPFEAKALMQAGLDEIRRQIREVEPPRPSNRLSTLEKATLTTTAQHRRTDPRELVHLIHGDLDWIVMRCLEKDRTRRYETANSLADDIVRHLGDEPVAARPPSTAYRFGKAIRRNQVAFGAGAAIAASLAIGLVVATTAYLKEKAAHEFAVEAALAEQKLGREAMNHSEEIRRLGLESRANEKKAKIEAVRNAYLVPLLKESVNGIASAPMDAAGRAPLLQALDTAADSLGRDASAPPEARIDIADVLGDVDMKLGEYHRAEKIYRELLALRRKLLGPMHADTTAALGKLLEALRRQGKSAEAEAAANSLKVLQSEYLKTRPWYFKDLGRELLRQGNYVQAEAALEKARKAYEKGGWGEFWATMLESDIMFARFQAGDFPGARELGERIIRFEDEQRWWATIENPPAGYLISDSFAPRAHIILGRIALREGNLLAANRYLLEAVATSTETMEERGWIDFDLAAELLQMGEKEKVMQFVNRLEKSHDVDWKSSVTHWASRPTSEDFSTEAQDRIKVVDFEQWKKDVAVGKVPEDWKNTLVPPPMVGSQVSKKRMSDPPRQSAVLREGRFLFSQLQYPICLQMLGGALALPILRRRSRGFEVFPRRTVAWYSALVVLSSIAGIFLLVAYWEGFQMRNQLIFQVVQAFYAVVVGTVLWELGRSLGGEIKTDRTTPLLRLALAYLAIFFALKGALTNGQGLAPDFVYFLAGFVPPLLWGTSIVIAVGVTRELWRWTERHGSRSMRARNYLYLAAPVLGAQVVSANWATLEGLQDISRPWAIALLWLNVLFPWLLVGGFVAAPKRAENAGI